MAFPVYSNAAYPPPVPMNASSGPATGMDEEDDDPTIAGSAAAAAAAAGRKGNVLPVWGNANTMNINPLILTNITGSPYFKVNLFEIKTYHEVVDEIYYKVDHLEPWERGSRKTAGQTGMCGGVRGVGAGGIVSSAYCLLYKMFTLKLTRKQVNGLLNHCDSPYIRGIGLMYIRYCQPPADFWDWYSPYLEDEEEIDIKAGGGKLMTVGELARMMLEKLEWFDTRFPRIPVNVQKQISEQLAELYPNSRHYGSSASAPVSRGHSRSREDEPPRARSRDRDDDRSKRRHRSRSRSRSKSRERKNRHRSRSRERRRSRDRSRDRSRNRDRSPKKHKKHKKGRSRSRSRDRSKRRRSRDGSSERRKHKKRDKARSPKSYADELREYSDDRRNKHKKHKRSRSRSRSR